MTRILALAIFASATAVYASDQPYRPASKPEQMEFAQDRLDVYPDDVRKDPHLYTNAAVAWVGIIKSTDARDRDSGNKVVAVTVLEHHYFDWVQDGKHCARLDISPRGEGQFSIYWTLKKTRYNSDFQDAQKLASPGKLAIVYGVPTGVEADGTVDLAYRYLRIVDKKKFDLNRYDYGRLGEPFYEIHGHAVMANSPTASLR